MPRLLAKLSLTRSAEVRHVGRSPEDLQHAFYSETAERYDAMHVREDDDHAAALQHISTLVAGLSLGSVLDVGTGTGRGITFLRQQHPELRLAGVEPVRAMIDLAESSHGIAEGVIVEGRGDRLPFAATAFDAVCELGVLHHVARPNDVVREMTRVARRAVFLSDANRFAGGGRLRGATKFALDRIGLWPSVYRLATNGRGFHLTDGDGGVVYSYSVYDSLSLLTEWADRVYLMPTAPVSPSVFHPLFTATNILVCALRDA